MSEIIEVRIDKLVFGGDGLGRIDGLAVFVPYTAPGDLVRARVVERRKGFLKAEITELLEAGPDRRAAPCPVYGRCGGCQLQHVAYPAQVAAKREFVRETLERIGRISIPGEIAIRFDADHEFAYRTRATAHLATTRDGTLFGFFGRKSHRVVDVVSCPLLVPELDSAWRAAREQRAELHRTPALELSAGDQGCSASPPVAAVGGKSLEAETHGFRYRFNPASFFQVNRYLLEALVAAVVDGASGTLAVDLFSGVGLFTLPLARRFERVVAVESNSQAASYARENARLNEVENVTVEAEAVEEWLASAAASELPIDLVVLDPPRTGLGTEAASDLARLGPRRIVYVSCDPGTLARDLRVLVEGGYEVESVEAFDLFPQTFHVETVVRLARPEL